MSNNVIEHNWLYQWDDQISQDIGEMLREAEKRWYAVHKANLMMECVWGLTHAYRDCSFDLPVVCPLSSAIDAIHNAGRDPLRYRPPVVE